MGHQDLWGAHIPWCHRKPAQQSTGVCRALSPTVAAGMLCLVGPDEAMGWLMRRWKVIESGHGQGAWTCGKRHGPGVAAGG
jgi:hypothetical protein